MPRNNEKIDFDHSGIGAVLANKNLEVPLNQREYSWEKEHVEELFTDLMGAITKPNSPPYFLGTIVLTQGLNNTPEVADGQQRLATTTILLAAIRDYFFWAGDEVRSRATENDFLTKTSRESRAPVPKLRLNVDDRHFFEQYVLATPGSKERKAAKPRCESHRRIAEAASLAAIHVKNIVTPYADVDKAEVLLRWMRYIEEDAEVIVLLVPDHLDAFTMFETLNDRGLKASQADLIKNHLLRHAKARIAEAQQKWAKMSGALESIGQGDLTVMFLHHWLITKEGPTKAADVFRKIKDRSDSELSTMTVLDDLANSANDYTALYNSDHLRWNAYGTKTRKNIETINVDLRVSQIRPLMFAILRHFSTKEAEKAFELFVSWSVRFLIVGGRGGLLDRNYSIAAEMVTSGNIRTSQQLTAELIDIIPSDALFETAFSEQRISQMHLARYLLKSLENTRQGVHGSEHIPHEDEKVVNIEHILPENPHGDWNHIDQDVAAANYRKIGNQTILLARTNSIIGNNSFDVKKLEYAKSGFLITSDIAKETTWGPDQIRSRQKQLAKLAVKTWPINVYR